MRIDLYWSFFSGYCYLAGVRLERARASHPFPIALKPVWPLAFRVPKALFEAPRAYAPYYDLDTARVARHLSVAYADPEPPPVALDWNKKMPAADQPHIRRLTRLGVEAERRGNGFAGARAISDCLFAGGPGWDKGGRLASALAKAGLDLADMERTIARETDALDAIVLANGRALEAAGHWGTPTMVLDGEPFFGQDRVDLLLWRMDEKSRA